MNLKKKPKVFYKEFNIAKHINEKRTYKVINFFIAVYVLNQIVTILCTWVYLSVTLAVR